MSGMRSCVRNLVWNMVAVNSMGLWYASLFVYVFCKLECIS